MESEKEKLDRVRREMEEERDRMLKEKEEALINEQEN